MYLSGMGWDDVGCVFLDYKRGQGPTHVNVEMDVRVM